MAYSYDPISHVYLKDGTPLSWGIINDARESYLAAQSREARRIAGMLTSGEFSLDQWLQEMRSLVKRTYVSSYILGRGGRSNMGYGDWGRIGGLLTRQYRFLLAFASDISLGNLSDAQIAARAELYIHSAVQAFERARGSARGISLPAYPGDGSTQCGVNCKCHWEIIDADDFWSCSWVLGAAEHCDDCVERSNAWAPIMVAK